MGTNRKRLVAAAASLVVAAGLAGCGGDSGGGSSSPSGKPTQTVTKAVKGGTVYSLEQSVTEHLDPQRTYVGRDIANLGRLVYRSWVQFPAGETDAAKGSTPIPDLAPPPRPRPGEEKRAPPPGVFPAQGRSEGAGRKADHL